MPYIKETDKQRFDLIELERIGRSAQNAGQLNFLFTVLAKEYFAERGNYAAINDVIGALEGAKTEFYRRVAAPYEDKKIAENGDVY